MEDLDRWTRVLPLGAGAFGEVHLAWDTTSLEWVALKRFTGQDELGLLRFVIESRIRVSHPHLVRTLAFRLVDDRAWLVTQLARGGSLRGLIARTGPLAWGWVAEAVDQVLSALVALHATGVVHRDLKPANLLLRDGGAVHPHLLVGDFGIATWRTVSMTGIGAAIGTPGYLAPEYLDGQQPAPATDLFALGVLAAELLTGRRLVHYSNASPDIPSSWSHTLPLPDAVPAQLAAVLRRMADPDPRRRYIDASQAREALLAASPPGTRGDLTAVEAPDLLASVPPGWTIAGPEQQTVVVSAGDKPLTEARHEPAAAVPVIATAEPSTETRHEPAAAPPVAPATAEDEPLTQTRHEPATTSPAKPSPAAVPATTNAEPHPDTRHGPPATPPAKPSSAGVPVAANAKTRHEPAAAPPVAPATAEGKPLTEMRHQPPATPPAKPSPAAGPVAANAEPRTEVRQQPPATPPKPFAVPVAEARHAPPARQAPVSSVAATPQDTGPAPHRKRRRARRAVLLLVLLILAGGGGTLWWAATHRTVAGQPTSAGRTTTDGGSPDWTPVLVEPCSKVERGRERDDGAERCQRTANAAAEQYWVKEPSGGFPVSDPAGPFPAEPCTDDGATAYTPVGKKVLCANGTWRITT